MGNTSRASAGHSIEPEIMPGSSVHRNDHIRSFLEQEDSSLLFLASSGQVTVCDINHPRRLTSHQDLGNRLNSSGIAYLAQGVVALPGSAGVQLQDVCRCEVVKVLGHDPGRTLVKQEGYREVVVCTSSVLVAGRLSHGAEVALWRVNMDETPAHLCGGNPEILRAGMEGVQSFLGLRSLEDSSFDNRIMASVRLETYGPSATVVVLDLERGEAIGRLKEPHAALVSAEMDSEGATMITGSSIGGIKLWDVMTLMETSSFGLEFQVGCGCWSSAGRKCIHGLRDGRVVVWDLRNVSIPFSIWKAHRQSVSNSCEIDVGRFVTASRDNSLKVWSLDGKMIGDPVFLPNTVTHSCFVGSEQFDFCGLRVEEVCSFLREKSFVLRLRVNLVCRSFKCSMGLLLEKR